jgi:F0F1-type ATP synthase assembly protein I
MLVSMGLVVNGILDYMMDYVGLYSSQPLMYALEILIGFALAASSVVLHNRIKKNYGQKERPEAVADEVL